LTKVVNYLNQIKQLTSQIAHLGHAPDKRLIVEIPDSDVTITAAAKADLGVRTDGERIARSCS